MKHLQSYHPYETRIQGVLLPRSQYSKFETQAGKRSVIRLSDEQFEALNGTKTFRHLLRRAQNGGYVLIDRVPDSMKTDAERLFEAELEIARLRKQQVPERAADARQPDREPTSPADGVYDRMPYEELKALAVSRGMKLTNSNRGRKALADFLRHADEVNGPVSYAGAEQSVGGSVTVDQPSSEGSAQ